MSDDTEMTADGVIGLYDALDDLGVEVWIDGGWGVDALLGVQTRPHADLDIVIQQNDVPKLRELLEAQGYEDVERDDTSPWNFVLGDDGGHEVDVHAIVFDDDGNGLYGPAEKGVMYPAASLSGTGTINGHRVRCISAEWMVRFHTGYELHDTDFMDVSALCERFGIPYPKGYAHLKKPKCRTQPQMKPKQGTDCPVSPPNAPTARYDAVQNGTEWNT